MGDTTIVYGTDSFYKQLNALPPSLRDSIIQLMQTDQNPQSDTASPVMTILFYLVVIAIVVYLVGFRRNPLRNPASQADGYFYNGQEIVLQDTDIVFILQKYFTYYTNLTETWQAYFIKRLRQFMRTKTFHLPKDKTYKEMPVLLSATAVQLMFGLPDSLLPWFRYINVTLKEFVTDDDHDPHVLAGNVEGHSINIAWNHFLEGIADCEDGSNVGLHELAHALYYEYIAAEKGGDIRFTNDLRKVMHEIEMIYKQGEYGQMLFSDYAFRNTQECWAESIELFFEKPDAMQARFPDLFFHLTRLLRQDPRNKTNPVLQ